MTHGSLFSGIGGFDLAAEWMGWENKFHCEWNPFGQKVLKYYWPEAESFNDITKSNFEKYAGTIDVISGGFPCQDASIAKQCGEGQQGLKGKRTGLFYEMLRCISEIKPKYIVAENVANILKTNEGNDFRTILHELSAMGYNAEWRVCYASEVGAAHRRARCYLVAYPNSIRLLQNESFFCDVHTKIPQVRRFIAGTTASVGVHWPIEPPVQYVDDGLPDRLDGSTFSKWRNESIKAGGNAIVPQVAFQIFKAIQTLNNANL
jgi:DNA (cytosine-5)-methyltransferase 1